MTEDLESRRKKVATLAKWGLGLAGAVIISPIVFFAVKGIVGLVLAFVVGQAVIHLAPVFSLKLANLRIKLLTKEVEGNPIETLINLRIEKEKELAHADQQIVEFETEVLNYDDETKVFKKKYPDEAAAYELISEKMHTALKDMETNQDEAKQGLENLKATIDKAQAIYKMSLAAQKVAALSKTAEDQVFADIKQKVAFDTVRSQLNRSFASLNQAVGRRREIQSSVTLLPGQAEEPAGKIIDLPRKEASS